eukprot:8284102-Prorocentrum_lima.AAC.1
MHAYIVVLRLLGASQPNTGAFSTAQSTSGGIIPNFVSVDAGCTRMIQSPFSSKEAYRKAFTS